MPVTMELASAAKTLTWDDISDVARRACSILGCTGADVTEYDTARYRVDSL